MNRTLTLFFGFIVFCTLAQAQKTEYFRRIRFDDRQYTIVPREKVDVSLMEKTNYYQITFDEQNRIQHVRYMMYGTWTGKREQLVDIKIEYTDTTECRLFNYSDKYEPNEALRTRLETLILDKDKNPVAVVYSDKDGKYFAKNKHRVTHYERILNADGWAVEVRFYDAHGKRITNSNGDYCYRNEWKNDSIFYIPETSYYDKKGNLHTGKRGYAVIQSAFYKAGERQIYENRYLNKKRQAVSKLYAVSRREYYDNGLLKSISYFDKNGKPVHNKQGVAVVRYQYDEAGRQQTMETFNKKGKSLLKTVY